MKTKLAIVFGAGLAAVMMMWSAQAAPMAAAKHIYQNKEITFVAQGCGRGWHWSYALRRCVP